MCRRSASTRQIRRTCGSESPNLGRRRTSQNSCSRAGEMYPSTRPAISCSSTSADGHRRRWLKPGRWYRRRFAWSGLFAVLGDFTFYSVGSNPAFSTDLIAQCEDVRPLPLALDVEPGGLANESDRERDSLSAMSSSSFSKESCRDRFMVLFMAHLNTHHTNLVCPEQASNRGKGSTLHPLDRLDAQQVQT